MKIEHYSRTDSRRVNLEGAKSVTMRWLISHREKAPNFAMRMFEVECQGHTPLHTHENEHEVFVLQGRGTLVINNDQENFEAGYVIYVPPGVEHQFKNSGEETLQFLCLVPHEKGK